MHYRKHFLHWGRDLCTTGIAFCTGGRSLVLRKSLSVLGRESVYYRDHFLYRGERQSLYYRGHFMYWGEHLCTTEITFCTGEGICVLPRPLSVLGKESAHYGDRFLYWGEYLCTVRRPFSPLGRESVYYGGHFVSAESICVLPRSLSVLGRESVYY